MKTVTGFSTPEEAALDLELPLLGALKSDPDTDGPVAAALPVHEERRRDYRRAVDRILLAPLARMGSIGLIGDVTASRRAQVAAQLAASLAAERTAILIDADLRAAHLSFDDVERAQEGLVDVLRYGVRSPRVVSPTRAAGLSLLPVGSGTVDFAGTYGSGAVPSLFDELRRSGDLILINGPDLGDFQAAAPFLTQVAAWILIHEIGVSDSAKTRTLRGTFGREKCLGLLALLPENLEESLEIASAVGAPDQPPSIDLVLTAAAETTSGLVEPAAPVEAAPAGETLDSEEIHELELEGAEVLSGELEPERSVAPGPDAQSEAGPSEAGPSEAGPSEAGPSEPRPSDAGPSEVARSEAEPSEPGPSEPAKAAAQSEPAATESSVTEPSADAEGDPSGADGSPSEPGDSEDATVLSGSGGGRGLSPVIWIVGAAAVILFGLFVLRGGPLGGDSTAPDQSPSGPGAAPSGADVATVGPGFSPGDEAVPDAFESSPAGPDANIPSTGISPTSEPPTNPESAVVDEAPVASAATAPAAKAPASPGLATTGPADASSAPARPDAVGPGTTPRVDRTAPVGTTGGLFYVHVSSLKSKVGASIEAARIQRAGYPTAMRQVEIPERGTWWRVYLGPYGAHADAVEVGNAAKEAGLTDYTQIHRLSTGEVE